MISSEFFFYIFDEIFIFEWTQSVAPISWNHFFLHRKSRTTFDTSDTRRAYGPIVIDYAKVQAKVTLKYDSWHKEALSKFGSLLGNEMQTFHAKVSKSRSDLEMQSIGKTWTGGGN